MRLSRLSPLALFFVAAPLAAQGYVLPLEWRWYVGGAIGLNVGNAATFNAIDAALRSGGWNTLASQCSGISGCSTPAGYAEEKRKPLTISVRRVFSERFQVRLFGSLVRPGQLNATFGANYRASVSPAVTVISAQAVGVVGPLWAGVGPSVNLVRVTSGAQSALTTSNGTKPGVAVAAGFTFPKHKPLWLEFAAERRFVGAVDVPAKPVTGAPDVPAMRIPMSHTVLSIGLGWRIP